MDLTPPPDQANKPLILQTRLASLFWTQALGAFNDNLFKNAIIMLVTFGAVQSTLTPATLVPAAGAIFILPFFLFSGISGVLTDKYEKATIIRATKLLEIGVMAVGAVGFVTQNVYLLLAVLFFMGLQSTIFGPAKYSILPEILSTRELVQGNALIEFGTFLSILLGTMAGVVVTFPNGTSIVSATVIAVAIVGWLQSRKIPSSGVADPSLAMTWNPIRPTIEILQQTTKFKGILQAVLGISWFWFFGATFLQLFPTFTKDLLAADENVATLLLATFSVGIGIGSLICGRLSRGGLELGLVPVGTLGLSLFTADLALLHIPWAGLAANTNSLSSFVNSSVGLRIIFDLSMISVFGGFFIVPLYTFIQERSEASQRSRVVAGNNIINAFFMVVASGALIAANSLGMTNQDVFLVLAVLNLIVAIYIYTVIPEFTLRFIAFIVSRIMYRLQITGRDNIPTHGPALLVCNHVSFIDWLILGGAVTRPIRFVMYWKIAQIPIARYLLRDAKVIPIAPEKENAQMKAAAFERIHEELLDGQVVCIFPEGKLTSDGQIDTFKSGVEKILERDSVPVIPMALDGLWGSWFSRKDGVAIAKIPRRFWSRVRLSIGLPVSPDVADAQTLEQQVRALKLAPPAP